MIGLAVVIIVGLELAYALFDRVQAWWCDPVRTRDRRDRKFARAHMMRNRGTR